MNALQASLLGIVEGLTEFIPVSSTGHLIIARNLLGIHGEGVDSYLIVIQSGALLAAMIYYRNRVWELTRGLGFQNRSDSLFLGKVATAFFPAAILGLLLDKTIQTKLFSPLTVALALIVGGVAMIAADLWIRRQSQPKSSLESLTFLDALWVGIGQCFSLWPGMSRSMTTIVSGQLRGVSTAAATDFSFVLAIPVLGGATLYKMFKERHALIELAKTDTFPLILGWVVSFLVGYLAIAGFIRTLKRFGMAPYGIYRILLGAVLIAAMASGAMAFQ